jgi:trehalose 6-phosphate phosphatase
MRYLFGPDGDAAMRALLTRRSLIALDYDGTLAPLAPTPDRARTMSGVLEPLRHLDQLATVAILSGRRVEDVAERMAFRPRYIVGNHGSEGLPIAEERTALFAATCRQWLHQLTDMPASGVTQPGIFIEDKTLSLSVHYRICRDRNSAVRSIESRIAKLHPTPRIIGGHCVINILPPDSPDKSSALHQLLVLSHSNNALYAGDDATDEVVFAAAPRNWITVRVGFVPTSAALFFVHNQAEIPTLLNRLVARLRAAPVLPAAANDGSCHL